MARVPAQSSAVHGGELGDASRHVRDVVKFRRVVLLLHARDVPVLLSRHT